MLDLLSQKSSCTSRQLPMSRSQTAIMHTVHLRSVVHHRYARDIPRLTHIRRSQGVATDRSPVITHHVAYALCSKNVVRVNEAKLHTEVSYTKDILHGFTPTDPHRLLFCSFYLRSRFSQSIASNCSPEVTLTFPRTYVRTKNL